MLPPTLSNNLTVTRCCRKQTCQTTTLHSAEGSWAKTLQIFQFSMWNTLYSPRVNRNGDNPTITADSFNTVTFFFCCSSLKLQMRHTNHTTICSDRRSPFSPPPSWPEPGHRTCREALRASTEHSQLFALQHGLGRGAGEEDGAGLRCGESWLDVKPLACQSCVAAACARSLPHGRRDALMPLCWRCSRQLVLLLGVTRLNIEHMS